MKEKNSIQKKPSLLRRRSKQRTGSTKKWMRLSVQDSLKKLKTLRDRQNWPRKDKSLKKRSAARQKRMLL